MSDLEWTSDNEEKIPEVKTTEKQRSPKITHEQISEPHESQKQKLDVKEQNKENHDDDKYFSVEKQIQTKIDTQKKQETQSEEQKSEEQWGDDQEEGKKAINGGQKKQENQTQQIKLDRGAQKQADNQENMQVQNSNKELQPEKKQIEADKKSQQKQNDIGQQIEISPNQASMSWCEADDPKPFKKKNSPNEDSKASYELPGGRGNGGFHTGQTSSNNEITGGRGASFGGRGGGFNRDDEDRGGRGGGFNRDNGDRGGRGGGFNRDDDDRGGRGGFNRDGVRGGFNRDNGGRGGRQRDFGNQNGFGGRDFGDRNQGRGRGRGRGRGGYDRDGGSFGQGNSYRDQGGRGNYGDRDSGFGRGNNYRDRNDGNFGRGNNFNRNQGGYQNNRYNNDNRISQREQPIENILSEIEPEPSFNFNQISVIQGTTKPKTASKTQEYRINKTMAQEPIGLKCWPSVSIYIKRTKVSFYMSRISDHICSILLFPYSEYYLDLYPGNMINQSPFDYKKKLKERQKEVGEVYFQKCLGIKQFEAIAFVKIDKQKLSMMKDIIKQLVTKGSALNSGFDSILIPYSRDLGSMKEIAEGILEGLENNGKYLEIIVSTNNPSDFIPGSQQFLTLIQQLADKNQIVIQ